MHEGFLFAAGIVMNLVASFFAFEWETDDAATSFVDSATSTGEENAPQQQAKVTPEAYLGESANRVDNETMEDELVIANKPLGNMYLPIAELPSDRKFKAGRLEAIPEIGVVLPANGRLRRPQAPEVRGK